MGKEMEVGGGQRSAGATFSSAVVLELDSNNNEKPGKGFKHGRGMVRFASLKEHPGCSARRNGGSPSSVRRTGRGLLHSPR